MCSRSKAADGALDGYLTLFRIFFSSAVLLLARQRFCANRRVLFNGVCWCVGQSICLCLCVWQARAVKMGFKNVDFIAILQKKT